MLPPCPALNARQSIILYSSGPVHFHIICDEDAHTYLEKRLALIQRPKYDLLVRFYRLSHADMTRRLEREGAINTDHSAGVRESLDICIGLRNH